LYDIFEKMLKIIKIMFEKNLKKPLDTRIVKVEGNELRVKGIERTIESISDIPTTWQIYFSADGLAFT